MKVIIEAQPITKTRSGIGWYAYHIIKEMIKLQRDDMTLIGTAFDFNGRNNAKKSLEEVGFKEIEISQIMPYRAYKMLWDVVPLTYTSFFSKADIYHFFNYVVPPKIKGIVITNIYDVVYKLYPETMAKSNLYILNREMGKSVNRASRIITISECAKKNIMEYLDVPEEKIRIIYPAVNHALFSKVQLTDSQTRSKVKAKYDLPDQYILYLGTIEPRKNIERIFEAYSLLDKDLRKEVKLVIAGVKGWKCDEIIKAPNRLNISNDVRFVGHVDEVDKPLIYNMAKIFVFPSLYEGFGMPVLEALAAGIPVITSNSSSMPEAGGKAAVYVDPYDSSSIAHNLMLLLSDENMRNERIILGHQHIQNFNWRSSAVRTSNIYRELV